MTRSRKIDSPPIDLFDPLDPLHESLEKVLLSHPKGRWAAIMETFPSRVQRPPKAKKNQLSAK
jgi:hypothetical protein